MKKRGVCENDVISVCSRLHSDTFKPIIASFLIGTKTISLDPTLSLGIPISTLRKLSIQYFVLCMKYNVTQTLYGLFGHRAL